MTIPRRDTPTDFEGVQQRFQDIINRVTLEDLNVGELRTTAPATGDMDKGKVTIVELSGVPWVYYRTISGPLYKIAMTAV